MSSNQIENHFVTNQPRRSAKASFSSSLIFIIIKNKLLIQIFVQRKSSVV